MVWEPLEQWSATALLAAGVLLFGFAVLSSIQTVTEITFQSTLRTAYGVIGLLATVVGLLGLYPRMKDNASRMSLVGVVATIVSGVLTGVILLWLVVTTLQMEGLPELPADAPAWTAVATLLVFLLLAVAFLLFGLISLRTAVFPRTVALLLLVPAAGWFGLIAASMIFPSGAYLSVLAYTPISVALVAVWYLLRTEAKPADAGESISEPPA